MNEEHERRQMVEIRTNLSATAKLNDRGKFEVLAITAGEGNGWVFSETCLKESLPLWEGLECFVDHEENQQPGKRSVRDLAGVFRRPRWDETARGIVLELETLGPAGKMVEEIGKEVTSQGLPVPRVGFSADLIFTAVGKAVKRIVRVLELDLVFNPARGGAFIRSLNSKTKVGGAHMHETQTNHPPGEESPTGELLTPLHSGAETAHSLLSNQEEHQQLAAEASKARAVRQQMCQYLLESGLAFSRLPAAMAEHVRSQFEGRAFEPAELDAAVEKARKLMSELTGGSVITGPGARIHSMFNSEDHLQAAVDDLLEAKREKGAENLKTARLSGVKELYMMLTGDRDLYGGYYADRVQLATTANFTGLVKNAMNKIVVEQWEQLGAAGYEWWRKIVTVEHFDTLNQITGILVGTVGALPSIAEGGEYTELKIGDSPETASFTKYGGYIPLTMELIDRDETRRLRQYPRELAKAGIRQLSKLVADIFTANSGTGPVMADGGALFNNTAVTTAGGHANLRTGALAADEWEAAKQAMYKQPLLLANETNYTGKGPHSAVRPRFLLVPIELELTAKKLLYGEWVHAANIHSDNLQRQMEGDVVVVPDWDDLNDWAAAADPRLIPGIVVGERFGLMPEIFIAGDELSPAVFMNDEHRIKVRHYLAVLVQDFRALHKNNVA